MAGFSQCDVPPSLYPLSVAVYWLSASHMPPKAKSPAKTGPSTINDYKIALLKLKVTLPTKGATLKDYQAAYEAATAPPPTPGSKRKAPAVQNKSPAPQRQRSDTGPSATANVPLGQQQAPVSAGKRRATTNTPLSQQSPANAPLSRQSPAANVPLSRQSPGNTPLSQQSPGNVPLSRQPPANVPLSRQPPANVPLSQQHAAVAASAASSSWYAPSAGWGSGLFGPASASVASPARPPPVLVPSPQWGGSAAGGSGPASSASASRNVPLSAQQQQTHHHYQQQPSPSYAFGGDAHDAEPFDDAEPAAAWRSGLAVLGLRLLTVLAGAVAAAAAAAVAAWLGSPGVADALARGTAAARELPQLVLHRLLDGAAAGAGALANGAFTLLLSLPQLAVDVLGWAYRLPRTEKLGLLVTLAALYFLQRACVSLSRYRRARAAEYERVVDGAARWVVTELRDQHQRWRGVGGDGHLLGADDLRRRMPDEARAAGWADVERRLLSPGLACRRAAADRWEWVSPQQQQ